jgi:hypothetical protein
MRQIADDESTAAKLRLEIEQYRATHARSESTLDDAQEVLKQQKHITRDKATEKQLLQQKLDGVFSALREVQAEQSKLNNSLAQVARLIHCGLNDPVFFGKLRDRITRPPPLTEQLFHELADAAGIPRLPDSDFDIPRFLDEAAFRYGNVVHASRLAEGAENIVQGRLQERRDEIARKQAKVRKLQASVRAAEADLATQIEVAQNHERQFQQRLQALKEAEYRALSSTARAIGIKLPSDRPPSELGRALIAALATHVGDLQKARAEREQRNAEFTERINQGIQVVEQATKTIAQSNRRLLRTIQTVDLPRNANLEIGIIS